MRIVIEVKRDAVEVVLNLYSQTQLVSFGINMVALHHGRIMNLKDIIAAFVRRREVVTRRTISNCAARDRAHILEALARCWPTSN